MATGWWIVLICILGFIVLLVYSLCVASGRAAQWEEEERTARALKAINDGDIDIAKLEELAPEGFLTRSNITEAQWEEALNRYREAREREGMTVFPDLVTFFEDQEELGP